LNLRRPPIDPRVLEASWRFQLVAPLLDPRLNSSEKTKYRRELTREPVPHPRRGTVRLSLRTLRRWCQQARRDGMPGLLLEHRSDLGAVRSLPEGGLERALELREEDARRTVPQLIRLLEVERPDWKARIARSTLDRHLRKRGSVRRLTRAPEGPFRNFEAPEPNDLWQGDVLVGPMVRHGGSLVRCRIISWLDDHSRFVCHLEAYPDESLPSIEDSLKKAILKYGRPARIFVDNAWVYSGTTMDLACSTIGIHKIHSTARYPVSRGKQERFFRTLRDQLVREVENLEPLELQELNRLLQAWLSQYHSARHSRTHEAPEQRYSFRTFRPVAPDALEQAFWQWTTRAISPTGEIKLFGNVYRVDLSFAGRAKAVLRYDPFDMSRIIVWENGRKAAVATPERLVCVTRPGRPVPTRCQQSEAARRYLDELERAHRARLDQELNRTHYRPIPKPTQEETPE